MIPTASEAAMKAARAIETALCFEPDEAFVSTLARIIDEENADLLTSFVELLRMVEAAHRSLGMWTDTNPRIVKARTALSHHSPTQPKGENTNGHS